MEAQCSGSSILGSKGCVSCPNIFDSISQAYFYDSLWNMSIDGPKKVLLDAILINDWYVSNDLGPPKANVLKIDTLLHQNNQ